MKTLRFWGVALLALCLGAGFTACSDDDDENLNGGGTLKTKNSVTLQTPGTLSLVLGDKVQNITSLKITGSLNGDDIICLRQMLRCTDEDSDKRGMLTVLDLSDASIVEGGDNYYNGRCSTSNDIIGSYMFQYCESLEQISLPNGVTKINEYAFRGCLEMKYISLPNNITSIGSFAFYDCQKMQEITIPDLVTSISNCAFWHCSGLEKATIGIKVSSIGQQAFQGCSNISEINSKNSTPPTSSSYTFSDIDKENYVLNVPTGSKETYSQAKNWSEFVNVNEVDF